MSMPACSEMNVLIDDREMSIDDMQVEASRIEKLSDLTAEYKDRIFDDLRSVNMQLKADTTPLPKDVTPDESWWGNRVGPTEATANKMLQQTKDKQYLVGRWKNKSDFEKTEVMYLVEIHKKWSIPFACLIFILIAPLGVMNRKGG